MTQPKDTSELVARLREEALALHQTAWADISGGQQTTMSATLADEAADELVNAYRIIGEMREEIDRLRGAVTSARQVAKLRGCDIRRAEADALLPFFAETWEPLRYVADRADTGKSACQLASRARDLLDRGLVQARWMGSVYEWRAAALWEKT